MMQGRSWPRTVIAWTVTSAFWQPSAPADPGQVAGGREHLVEHRRGEPAGEGVVLRRVVAADEGDTPLGTVLAARQVHAHTVPEPGSRSRHVVPGTAEG